MSTEGVNRSSVHVMGIALGATSAVGGLAALMLTMRLADRLYSTGFSRSAVEFLFTPSKKSVALATSLVASGALIGNFVGVARRGTAPDATGTDETGETPHQVSDSDDSDADDISGVDSSSDSEPDVPPAIDSGAVTRALRAETMGVAGDQAVAMRELQYSLCTARNRGAFLADLGLEFDAQQLRDEMNGRIADGAPELSQEILQRLFTNAGLTLPAGDVESGRVLIAAELVRQIGDLNQLALALRGPITSTTKGVVETRCFDWTTLRNALGDSWLQYVDDVTMVGGVSLLSRVAPSVAWEPEHADTVVAALDGYRISDEVAMGAGQTISFLKAVWEAGWTAQRRAIVDYLQQNGIPFVSTADLDADFAMQVSEVMPRATFTALVRELNWEGEFQNAWDVPMDQAALVLQVLRSSRIHPSTFPAIVEGLRRNENVVTVLHEVVDALGGNRIGSRQIRQALLNLLAPEARPSS